MMSARFNAPKKGVVMAQDKKHEVKVKVQVLELSKAGSGVTLEISSEGERLGTIEIGHGSFGWRKGRGKSGFSRVDWTTFAKRAHKLFD
jgi:hypothetical protein